MSDYHEEKNFCSCISEDDFEIESLRMTSKNLDVFLSIRQDPLSRQSGADLEGERKGRTPLRFAHTCQFTYSRRTQFSVLMMEIVT